MKYTYHLHDLPYVNGLSMAVQLPLSSHPRASQASAGHMAAPARLNRLRRLGHFRLGLQLVAGRKDISSG